MKMTKLATIMGAGMLVAGAASAQTQTTTTTTTVVHVWDDPSGWWGNHWTYGGSPLYTENELSVDAFGSYLAPERKFSHLFQTNIRNTGSWGGGVGVNYFFLRNVGIGGDIDIPNNGGNFVDLIDGSLILRFPIDPTGLAPYIFGGGGRQTDPEWQWEEFGGVGLEFRLNPVTGVFADARYIWAQKTSDSLLLRAGLRFVF